MVETIERPAASVIEPPPSLKLVLGSPVIGVFGTPTRVCGSTKPGTSAARRPAVMIEARPAVAIVVAVALLVPIRMSRAAARSMLPVPVRMMRKLSRRTLPAVEPRAGFVSASTDSGCAAPKSEPAARRYDQVSFAVASKAAPRVVEAAGLLVKSVPATKPSLITAVTAEPGVVDAPFRIRSPPARKDSTPAVSLEVMVL